MAKQPQPHHHAPDSYSAGAPHHIPRVTLVCDWLTTPGGAEKVLLELHHMYPNAPIYTSQYSRKGIDWFSDADVRTGWLQIFPRFLRKFLGPLRQIYFSHLDLSDYDLVISVTGAEAKSVQTQKKTPISPLYHRSGKKSIAKAHTGAYHLCYCHVPTQYYWQMYDKYVKNPGFGILNPLVRVFFQLLVKPLRQADYRAAQRPDQFITISSYAQTQIRKYYHRESAIVAPPVDVKQFSTKDTLTSFDSSNRHTQVESSTSNKTFSTGNPPEVPRFSTRNPQATPDLSTKTAKLFHSFSTAFPQFYIIACRQVNWKRVDLAIQACQRARLPLLVVGNGSEQDYLRQLAGLTKSICFIPWVSSAELAYYLSRAKGYIFPSLEPFGIAAVEALAAGCPVIAYREGGSRDFVQDGKNGILFNEQNVVSLVGALQKAEKTSFNRAEVAKTAAKFDLSQFQKGIKRLVQKPREIKMAKGILGPKKQHEDS